MKRWMIRIALTFAVLLVAVPMALFFYWRAEVRDGIRRINAICEVKKGASLEEVLARANALGLSTNPMDDLHFDAFTPGPVAVKRGTDLKSLAKVEVTFTRFRYIPFERDYCMVNLEEGIVTSARVGYLD